MNFNLHQAQCHEVLRSWQSQRNDINHASDFVLPLFVGNDDDSIETITTMPDVFRYGGNKALDYLEPLVKSFGLKAVLLFPVATKSETDLDNDDGSDESDQETTDSSNEPPARSRSLSSSSFGDGQSSNVLPKRLLPSAEGSSAFYGPNNPFLQRQEDEDHLLGEAQIATSPEKSVSIPAAPTNTPDGRVRAGPVLALTSRKLDIKLIRGLALKEKHNPVLRLLPRLRARFPDLLIICDVCLCAFTSTGHCCLFEDHSIEARATFHQRLQAGGTTNFGLLNSFPISNKITCQYLAMLAVKYASLGCNMVAPSDMMDGRILTIREKLNEQQLHHVSIMSYSAKFASSFYGPFRQATSNAPEFGDRKAYQLPPGSRALAMRAVKRDIEQGADFVMVKPGGPYLDIIREIKERHPDVPVAVYQVSGEYAMLKLAAKAGILDLRNAVYEMLSSFRRAGATIIISYFTPEILQGKF